MHEPNTVLQFEENVPRPSIVRNISLQVQELPSDASQDEIPVPVRHSVPRTTIYVPNLEEMLRSILVVGDKRWPSYSKLIKREGPYYQHPFPKEKHLHSKDKDVKEPRNDFNGLYCLDDIVADPSSGFPTWLYEPYMILPKPFKKPESEKQSITLDTNTVQVTRDFPKYRFESVCRFLNIAFQQDRFIEPQYPVDIATLGPVSNDIVNPQREKTNYLLPVLQGLHGRSKILTHADVVQQTIEKSVGTASLGKIEQKNQKHIELPPILIVESKPQPLKLPKVKKTSSSPRGYAPRDLTPKFPSHFVPLVQGEKISSPSVSLAQGEKIKSH